MMNPLKNAIVKLNDACSQIEYLNAHPDLYPQACTLTWERIVKYWIKYIIAYGGESDYLPEKLYAYEMGFKYLSNEPDNVYLENMLSLKKFLGGCNDDN